MKTVFPHYRHRPGFCGVVAHTASESEHTNALCAPKSGVRLVYEREEVMLYGEPMKPYMRRNTALLVVVRRFYYGILWRFAEVV